MPDHKNNPATGDPEDAGGFWPFSLALYDHPGVADDAIMLQDSLGVDVNLLLFCCWAAYQGGVRLDTADLKHLETAIAPWRTNVTEVLRSTRRCLRTAEDIAPPGPSPEAIDEVRKKILAAELAAEAVAEESLNALLPLSGRRPDSESLARTARDNLLRYIDWASAAPRERFIDAIDRLARATASFADADTA